MPFLGFGTKVLIAPCSLPNHAELHGNDSDAIGNIKKMNQALLYAKERFLYTFICKRKTKINGVKTS